jgi:hypothetical protein
LYRILIININEHAEIDLDYFKKDETLVFS